MKRAVVGVIIAGLITGCADTVGPPSDLPSTWTAVAAGDYHSCALDVEGRAYCWGSNQFGQLGSEGFELSAWPQPVAGGHHFAQISAGFSHTCAVTEEGGAYCWGRGRLGQLGQGEAVDASTPVPVAGDWQFADISAGHGHSCGLSVDGVALCWGDNTDGQLGTGTDERAETVSSRVPVPVAESGLRFVSLSAGRTHTCGAALNGLTYCWGGNRQAQLGIGTFQSRARPVSVRGQVPLIRVSAGSETSCGLSFGGALQCWGSNDGGKLGIPGIALSGNPQTVQADFAFNAVSVGGGLHVCGVSLFGRAYCWGNNGRGQLGTGGDADSPIPVPAVTDRRLVDIATGLRHTCALDADGGILCWGDGAAGQLGNGSYDVRPEPTLIER